MAGIFIPSFPKARLHLSTSDVRYQRQIIDYETICSSQLDPIEEADFLHLALQRNTLETCRFPYNHDWVQILQRGNKQLYLQFWSNELNRAHYLRIDIESPATSIVQLPDAEFMESNIVAFDRISVTKRSGLFSPKDEDFAQFQVIANGHWTKVSEKHYNLQIIVFADYWANQTEPVAAGSDKINQKTDKQYFAVAEVIFTRSDASPFQILIKK